MSDSAPSPKTSSSPEVSCMAVEAALQVLADVRRDDEIVVTNQVSARLWPRLSKHSLDFNYNPSTMGGAVPLGVGLALAQPKRHVIVVSGDGSLLMSLGSLVTVVDSNATNLSVVVLDNARYEVTGGQKTPAANSRTDFAGLARAARFATVANYDDENAWRRDAADVLHRPGPRFVCLMTAPLRVDCLHDPAERPREQVRRLQAALNA